MTMDGQKLVDDYLSRLEWAAQSLPSGRRIDLLAEIRGHIEAARTAEQIEGEAGMRVLLDRLGAPEEIVAAAADSDETSGPMPRRQPGTQGPGPQGWAATASPAPATAPRSIAREIWAVVMLTAGSIVLPIAGWLVGAVLLWSSDRWRTREKVLGTLVVPGGIGLYALTVVLGPMLFLFGSFKSCFDSVAVQAGSGTGSEITGTCVESNPSSGTLVVLVAVVAVLAVASLVVPFFLLHVAKRRASSETAKPVGNQAHQPVG
jgi:hypothetical protein